MLSETLANHAAKANSATSFLSMPYTHRAVGCAEVINSLAQMKGLSSNVHYVLRLLAFQHFRPDDQIAEWADSELARLYDVNSEEVDDQSTFADDLEISDFCMGPTGKVEPSEDRTPPDFPFSRENKKTFVLKNDSKIIRQPEFLECVEENSPDRGVHGTEHPS